VAVFFFVATIGLTIYTVAIGLLSLASYLLLSAQGECSTGGDALATVVATFTALGTARIA
jgi:hypothetical protein